MAGYKLDSDTLETDKIFGRLDKYLDGPDAQNNIQELFYGFGLKKETTITRSGLPFLSLFTGSTDTITVTGKNTKAQISIRINRPGAFSDAKPEVFIEPTNLEESAPNMRLAARIAAKFAAPVSTSDISKEALNKERKLAKVRDLMRDRSVASQEDFTSSEEGKTSGVSAGYVGNEKSSLHDFMLKQFYKTTELANQKPTEEERIQAQKDRSDGVRELVGSTLYQFLLYDSAPKEQLVIPDEKHQDSLYVRSKFFDDSQGLEAWKASSANASSKLEGFERAIAACHILGEADYHQNNLMVETVDGEAKVKKIDHGKSFMIPVTDFHQTMRNTSSLLKRFKYLKHPHPINFNVTKYSESLNQMLEQLTPEQTDQIVDQKIDELKKAGFDPAGLTLDYFTDNSAPAEKTISSFEDLRTTMQESIHSNLERMRDVATKIEVITKFDLPEKVSQKFKDGQWLKEFATEEATDPVLYATKKGITIEGLDPLVWAQENNYKINSSTQTIEHTTTEPQWVRVGSKKEWKKPLAEDKVPEQPPVSQPQEASTQETSAQEQKTEATEQSPTQPQQPQEQETSTQERKKVATTKEQYSTGTSAQQYLQDHPELQVTPETKELIANSEVKKSPLEIKTELIVMVFDKELENKLAQPEVQELKKLVTTIPNNSSIEKFTEHMQAIKTWMASKSDLNSEVKSKLATISSAKPTDKSKSTQDINQAIKARGANKSDGLGR